MKLLTNSLDMARGWARRAAKHVARFLDHVSGRKITPNTITILSVLGHIPIVYCIATDRLSLAAFLLVIFGLMDTLDGELARLQHRSSAAGMLLDASTDRLKEAMLYTGIAYWCVQFSTPKAAAWATLAVGASMLVSYVKAKGETAIASSKVDHATVNKLFQDGLLRYEVRMGLLVFGLLASSLLVWIVGAIAVFSLVTALGRLINITRYLASKA